MKIGLIGVGNMGLPLCEIFMKHNKCISVLLETSNTQFSYQTRIYYQNDMESFFHKNDVIFSVLPNSTVTLDMVYQITKPKSSSSYWIDLCSSNPSDVKNISQRLHELGSLYMDAPVSGGPNGMRTSSLTSVTSGPKEAYDACKPLMNLYCKNITHISEQVGTSSAVKLANNTLLALHLVSAAEVFHGLKELNVSLHKALPFINQSSGRSWATMQRYPEHILTESFDYGFSFDLHQKDVNTFLDSTTLAERSPLLREIKLLYNDKKTKLDRHMDHTEIVKLIK
tara:strand:- start:441 stop:1289 length:849 start_codon:yes stop_codon:yes gene_type:complete